jgi:hypothetical protein
MSKSDVSTMDHHAIQVGEKIFIVKNRRDVNKVYQAVQPMIAEQRFQEVSHILAKACIAFYSIDKNLKKDQREGNHFLVLGDSWRYYIFSPINHLNGDVTESEVYQHLVFEAFQGLQHYYSSLTRP